ncbi:C39 family peptidase [Culicoidibacter larvae]|uniref:Peptidase C39-like domain-containing protein n=1 Tax=Culicoidibacter larvae TaxID=2579976 RepID=A0A5R8Q7B1_9FIRM|nr:C39 family peptidase [Culicoidibacter larvae]TLG71299.1 hypothetical protein FEZ08_11150 [Culicoidibacter larvae]TLG71303.1 hypothetical protein FEZ08_11170 [Culicoidibacter larvae]
MKKILFLLVCTLILSASIPVVVSAEDSVPTIEQIMKDYEVGSDEAINIQSRLQAEKDFYEFGAEVPLKIVPTPRSGNSIDYETQKLEFESRLYEAYENMDYAALEAIKQELIAASPDKEWANPLSRSTKQIAMNFYRQKNDYFCGPAAVAMALSVKNKYVDQYELANDRWLETSKRGLTPGQYISYTLNSFLGLGNWYVYRTVDTWDQSLFMSRITITLDAGYAPIVAVYQTGKTNVPKLVGHTYYDLRHFVPIYGYADRNGVYYKDSSSGLGGRFGGVPQSAYISAYDMSYLIWGGSITY